MTRFLCSLGCLCLTLAIVSFGGEESTASDAGGAADPASGHSRPQVRRTAQKVKKKVRKKAAGKKGAAEPTEAPEKTAPSGAENKTAAADETGLKFSRDIAPILVGNCTRCHNEQAMAKNANLDLTSYEKIRKGTPKHEVIVPNKPEESHLYLRLTGEETPKMPRQANQRPLSENAIEKVGQWIKEGAKLDAGIDPKAPITSYAAKPEDLARDALAKMKPEERDKLVETKGLERWKKGNAKDTPQVTPSKSFMLFGVLPKDRVTNTLKVLETQYAALRGLGMPGKESAAKIGLYVFNDRTSFVEFVRSTEGRELEPTDVGSARLGETEPYVAVIDPAGGKEEVVAAPARKGVRSKRSEEEATGAERSLVGTITEYLATGILRRDSDKVPLWLAYGVGSYFGARVDPRSIHTQKLRRAAYAQYDQGWISKASDALGGETKPEDIRAVGFGIVDSLYSDPRSRPVASAFIKAMLKGGDKLDENLQNGFGMTREDFLGWTGAFVFQSYGGRGR